MEPQSTKLDLWALVELFGHSKIAGRITEQNIAGTNMLRVDVPETVKQPEFSRLFGSAAIYAINPVDEVTAKFYAENLNIEPIKSWDVKELIKKNQQLLLSESLPGKVNKDIYTYGIGNLEKNDDDDDLEENLH